MPIMRPSVWMVPQELCHRAEWLWYCLWNSCKIFSQLRGRLAHFDYCCWTILDTGLAPVEGKLWQRTEPVLKLADRGGWKERMGPCGSTEEPDMKSTHSVNFHVWPKTCCSESQTTSTRKNKAGGLTSQWQDWAQSCSNPGSVVLAKDRHVGRWNRIESSERSLHIYGQLIFDKDEETIQWAKSSFFQQMVSG